MKLQHLRHFVALYEEGSVTRAARRLNIVQPAVSQQIAKLEEQLGQTLFQRTSKGMVPTQTGEQAYRHFLPILESLRHAELELTSRPDEIKGHVSIGVIDSVANCALSQTLVDFARKHPAVTIHVTGGYTLDLLAMLRARKLDAAIVIGSQHRNALCFMDIIREPLAAVWSAAEDLEFPPDLTLPELARYDLVIPSRRHGLRIILEAAAERTNTRLNPRMEFDELKAVDEFVQATRFVSILPRTVVQQSLMQGKLRSQLITPRISRSIACAYDPSRPMPKAVDVFVRTLHHNMKAATQRFNS